MAHNDDMQEMNAIGFETGRVFESGLSYESGLFSLINRRPSVT